MTHDASWGRIEAAETAESRTPSAHACFDECASMPLFDRDVLDSNTLSDRALQRELFDLYFGQAPSLFDKLKSALRDGAVGPWREAAHALKGTARTLGLMRLGEVSAVAEEAAPCADGLKRLEHVYGASVAAAEAFMGSAASAA